MIHLVGLPHTELDSGIYSMCAFTSKAVGFCRLMEKIGREVTVYWSGDYADAPHVDFVSVFDSKRRVATFGDNVPNDPAGTMEWDVDRHYWREFNAKVIAEIRTRIEPGDLIAISGGRIHQSIVDAFPDNSSIEPCAGYEGIAANTFICFESYAWRHYLYGVNNISNGRFMDAVIPGYIDPKEFTVGVNQNYAAYLGRLTQRKGVELAVDIAREVDIPLKVAGTGELTITGTNVECLGAVNVEQRRELLAHAAVLLVPTLYIEPYGTVHIEALMSGAAVCAPDFGVFTETIGAQYRFRSFDDALTIVERARREPKMVRGGRADEYRARFHPDLLAKSWDKWLDLIDAVRDGRNGFYKGTSRGQVA